MVYLQKVANDHMATETGMSGTVVPNFSRTIGEPFRVKLILPPKSSEPHVMITSYSVATVWSGSEQFASTWA